MPFSQITYHLQPLVGWGKMANSVLGQSKVKGGSVVVVVGGSVGGSVGGTVVGTVVGIVGGVGGVVIVLAQTLLPG